MRVFRLSLAALLVAACGTAEVPASTLVLSDDFESYANDAAMQAVWNEQAGALGTLDTTFGNPGQSMAHPGGITSNRLFGPTTPTDAQPILWEFDFYDDGAAAKRITGGLRDNGGGAALNSILEMGRYNDLANPAGGANVSGYGIRTVFIGGVPANWVVFPGNPAPQAGWHHFSALIRASSILFELDLGDDGSVDSSLSVSTPSGAGIAYNVARFGGPSNLSSAGGGGNFDNLSIQLVPEPSTFALASLGLLGLLVAGRRRIG